MSEEATVTILDLLNLALGSPEIGVVNLNLLHRFLLELVKHFHLARKPIDITDDIGIQSALEETKSQTHSLVYSSLSEHTDGKRSSDVKRRDRSALHDTEMCGNADDKKSGDGVGAPAGAASGADEGVSTNELVEGRESLQTTRSTGEVKIEDGKDAKLDPKQRNLYEKSRSMLESPLSRLSPVCKSGTHSPQSTRSGPTGRSSKDGKRTSPSSSKTDVRRRSHVETSGLYQLERKISVLEAKFESLSAGPTSLEIAQQARDLQSRDSGTNAAGDMWQAMSLVRRIEVTEAAINGITSMLDDISKQLKKMKDSQESGSLKDPLHKLEMVRENADKSSLDEMQAKLAEIDNKFEDIMGAKFNTIADEKFNSIIDSKIKDIVGDKFKDVLNDQLNNIVCKSDLKPFLTAQKINDIMDSKLQSYRRMSEAAAPAQRISVEKTRSSTPVQTEKVETSSQPVQTSPKVSSSGLEQSKFSSTGVEQVEPESRGTTEAVTPTRTRTPENETTNENIIEGEEVDSEKPQNKEVVSETAPSPKLVVVDERRESVSTDDFEGLCKSVKGLCDFRDQTTRKIIYIEEDLSDFTKAMQEFKNLVKKNQQQMKGDVKNVVELVYNIQQGSEGTTEGLDIRKSLQEIEFAAGQKELSQLESSVQEKLQALDKSLQDMKKKLSGLYEVNDRLDSLEELEGNVKSDMQYVRNELANVTKQLVHEQEARCTFASALDQKHSSSRGGDSDEFYQVRSSLFEMKQEMEKHNEAIAQIIDDQNKKQFHLDALYGHVGQLDNTKADRQQMNRDIEIKADHKDLAKKVSQDKFHDSMNSLDQSVQDLGEKLIGHEATLKQAINHINLDINSKLDKMDMDTVKDYFEGKLKDLNSKVQRKPAEDKSQAAGTRCLLLQPANCISCDRPLRLYREDKLPSLPLNKPLPPTKSNRPYLTFDLNEMRQKMYDVQSLHGDNQNESLGQLKVQNELLKLGAIKKSDELHAIPRRPCGGNHTLTCPEKRTTIRVNKAYREDLHFIAQISQKDLSIVDILGYDGRVYKGHVSQLPSIPEIPKTTITHRPTTAGSGQPRTSSPI